MSAFLSGRDISRRNYYESANYTSDFKPDLDPEDDNILPGDHGGKGVGLGGGYVPASKRVCEDNYGGYDPGMAGCCDGPGGGENCTIPGVSRIGCESYEGDPTCSPPLGPGKNFTCRGYEVDEYEYETPSESPGTPSDSPIPSRKPQVGKPSVGSRIIGRAEEFVGKVLRDREMEAKGKRHLTGHL